MIAIRGLAALRRIAFFRSDVVRLVLALPSSKGKLSVAKPRYLKIFKNTINEAHTLLYLQQSRTKSVTALQRLVYITDFDRLVCCIVCCHPEKNWPLAIAILNHLL